MSLSNSVEIFPEASAIAERLVRARLSMRALVDYPGPIPPDMASAYACQDAAIGLWPDQIAGWKIGLVPPAAQARVNAERLAGPIFSKAVRQAGPANALPMINGGFAAIEGEFVLRLGADAPAGKLNWTAAEALDLVEAMHIGVELAGSPLPGVNALGPTVTASDFGNNAGLVLGPVVRGWRERPLEDLHCEVTVEGVSVGRATAAAVPGGPIGALVFLLEHTARRGRPLRAGLLISTGAVTGVHQVFPGQSACASFGADGDIRCNLVAAEAADAKRPVGAGSR